MRKDGAKGLRKRERAKHKMREGIEFEVDGIEVEKEGEERGGDENCRFVEEGGSMEF